MGNSTPLTPKPLNRSSPKFVWVIMSVTLTPMQNLITIRLRLLVPQMCENSHQVTSFFFGGGGSSDSVQPRPLHRFLRSIRQMTSFRASMCLLGVSKTNFYISPHFRQKLEILGQFFDGTFRNFQLRKALINANINGDAHL